MRTLLLSIGIFVVTLACLFATFASAPAGPYVPPGIEPAASELVPIPLNEFAGGADPRTKWEYKVIEYGSGTDATKLNELGAEGWELCETRSQLNGGNTVQSILFFKRHVIPVKIFGPITPDPAPIDQ